MISNEEDDSGLLLLVLPCLGLPWPALKLSCSPTSCENSRQIQEVSGMTSSQGPVVEIGVVDVTLDGY